MISKTVQSALAASLNACLNCTYTKEGKWKGKKGKLS